MAATDEAITYMVNVHTVILCEEEDCDFVAEDYLTAVKESERHHRDTGHELRGEQGLAIWIGEEGRKYLDETTQGFSGPGDSGLHDRGQGRRLLKG